MTFLFRLRMEDIFVTRNSSSFIIFQHVSFCCSVQTASSLFFIWKPWFFLALLFLRIIRISLFWFPNLLLCLIMQFSMFLFLTFQISSFLHKIDNLRCYPSVLLWPFVCQVDCCNCTFLRYFPYFIVNYVWYWSCFASSKVKGTNNVFSLFINFYSRFTLNYIESSSQLHCAFYGVIFSSFL